MCPWTGPPIVDMATGMSACNAILLALIARDRLGRGQQVEVALIDTAVAMTAFYGMAYLVSGANPGRFGNSPNGSPTVGLYQASDGPLYVIGFDSDGSMASRSRLDAPEHLRATFGAVLPEGCGHSEPR